MDYKIKELKKQIEPRENDIKAMKEQIQEVNKIKHEFCLVENSDLKKEIHIIQVKSEVIRKRRKQS